MSRNVALLLFTLFAYTLVLAHGIVPHQHLHQAGTQAKHHTHNGHEHSHDHDEPQQKEHPFSHYFHSAVQGEPHVSARYSNLLTAPQAESISAEFLFVPKVAAFTRLMVSDLHAIGFSPPPHHTHLPQRGPPSA